MKTFIKLSLFTTPLLLAGCLQVTHIPEVEKSPSQSKLAVGEQTIGDKNCVVMNLSWNDNGKLDHGGRMSFESNEIAYVTPQSAGESSYTLAANLRCTDSRGSMVAGYAGLAKIESDKCYMLREVGDKTTVRTKGQTIFGVRAPKVTTSRLLSFDPVEVNCAEMDDWIAEKVEAKGFSIFDSLDELSRR